VWGYQGEEGEARELLKVHINRTRHKMRGLAEGGDRYIQSVRGFGYMLPLRMDDHRGPSV
jgi:DNA-binding response OmpR family regulator